MPVVRSLTIRLKKNRKNDMKPTAAAALFPLPSRHSRFE